MGQQRLGAVGTVAGIGALLFVVMPQPATPGSPAAAVTIAPSPSAAPVAPIASTPAPTVPSAVGSTAFISGVHQYAFMLPPDWTARASKDAAIPDLVDGPDGRVLAVWLARPPEGGATDAWIADRVPLRRIEIGSCIRDTRFPSGRNRFVDSSVGDLEARVRRSCGHVDAVAIAGDRAWIVSLADDSSPMGDMGSFRLLTDTFGSLPDPDAPRPSPRPAPTPPPGPTAPPDWLVFTSTRHGYSLRYPADWTAHPAEIPGEADVFFQGNNELPRGQNRLLVYRRSGPARPFAVAWAEAMMPKRAGANGDHRHCLHASGGFLTIEAPPATFRPTEIRGRPAAIRSLCSHVDVVIDLRQDVLVMSHVSARPMPTGNDEIVAKFLAGLRLAEDD